MDETPSLNGKTAYAWVCSGNDSVAYTLEQSRSSTVIKNSYPNILDKPITCDGYAGYNIFDNTEVLGTHITGTKRCIRARSTGNIT